MLEAGCQHTWVVVAAYNEQSTVGTVAANLVEAGWKVVVVDDGSVDDTGVVARAAGATVLRHVVNLGQGAALQTGIDYALTQHAKFLVTFDADAQHRVEDIPALLGALEHAEVALGSRWLGQAEGVTPGRKMLLRVATWLSNRLSGLHLTDTHCGLRAFRAEIIPRLRMRQARMAHASEILTLVKKSGARVVEVPVHVEYTPYSRSKGQSGLEAIRILFDHFFRT